jgi:hypothetical protein
VCSVQYLHGLFTDTSAPPPLHWWAEKTAAAVTAAASFSTHGLPTGLGPGPGLGLGLSLSLSLSLLLNKLRRGGPRSSVLLLAPFARGALRMCTFSAVESLVSEVEAK